MPEWLDYIDRNGFIHMCERCRLVKKTSNPHRWTLIAGWYEEPPENTRMVICPECEEDE